MFQLGIDVSKKTLDLCLLREGVKGRVKTRKLQNDINAVSAVIAWLSSNIVNLKMSISSWKPLVFIMNHWLMGFTKPGAGYH